MRSTMYVFVAWPSIKLVIEPQLSTSHIYKER